MHIVLILTLIAGEIIIADVIENERKKRICQAAFGGILLFLFAALRSENVGVDSLTYAQAFEFDAKLSFKEILNIGAGYMQSTDPVFHCFLYLLSLINTDPQIMFIVISAIVAVSVSVLFHRYSEDILLSFVIFITLRMFSFTVTGLRQAMAMAILWWAIPQIKNKKPIRFILIVLAASLFHSSSFIFILAYPLARVKRILLSAYSIISAGIICILTNNAPIRMFLSLPFLGRFSSYLEQESSGGSSTAVIYLGIILFALFAYNYFVRTCDEQEIQKVNVEYNLAIWGVFLSLIGLSYANLFRMGYYFAIILYILLPRLIGAMKSSSDRTIIKMTLIILLAGQYIYLGPSAGLAPYEFFWEAM